MMKENRGDKISDQLFELFSDCDVKELENALVLADEREKKAFYRALINLKLQFEQEKIIGEQLL